MFKEDFGEMVRVGDDDGVLCIEVGESGKSRGEDRMCGEIRERGLLVEFFEWGV